MKRKVFLKRFYHRDKLCIGIFFGYDEKLRASVKSIGGVTWSNSNKCFYLDDKEDSIKLILKMLRDIADVDISAISGSDRFPDAEPVTSSQESLLTDVVTDKRSNAPEELPPGFVQDKKEQENALLPSQKAITKVAGRGKYGPVDFTIRENENLLVIRFRGQYDAEWIDEMRTYGRLRYDKARREWLLEWKKITCDSLADYFASRGVEVSVTRQALSDALKDIRQVTGDEIRAREFGAKAAEALERMKKHLEENRYSLRTTKSYLPLLELFFRYYNTTDPEDITIDQVSHFVHEFIIKNGYSASYQNQVVSAIKTWYEISGTGRINPVLLDRPRRGRSLPKVFSKDEVKRILNATRNGKHKLLLWLAYSCGLRRSELINIKLEDLDRSRGLINIMEGKGKVDRIVPVPDKVWEKIDDYIGGYTPKVYLLEGQGGGQYSVESVYQVFKQALRRAGIKKDVGIHSLRHSYATHLHENGLDIRYIQELLGHKSTKTTEIYTHVSRRNLAAVRSPIEDMDVK
jgi:integrase/recombinase XerD